MYHTYYWYNTVCLNAGIDVKTLPMVGIIVQKSHINGKDDIQYVTLISRLESRGARFVPIYTSELDFFSPLAENNCDANGKTNVDTVINLTGSKHVWGAASQDDKKVVSVLKQLDPPSKRAMPLVVQSFEESQSSDRGLHPTQVVLKVSLLEIDCPVKPILHAGRELAMGRSVQLADDRVNCPLKWPDLRIKHSKENKSAITIFSSPLDRGIVGTAVYPDVFDSAVLHQFKKKRYDIGGAPNSKEAIMDARINSSITPHVRDLKLNSDGQKFFVNGKQFDNVFIKVRPSFRKESDPTQLVFAKSAGLHRGFAAYYTDLDKIVKAEVILHLGINRSSEFMPGKHMSRSGRIINFLLSAYLYAASTSSDATIAMRRYYSATVSYLMPGLFKGLKELKELISSYQGLCEIKVQGAAIVFSILFTAWTCNLDKVFEATNVDLDRRDGITGVIYAQITKIESRLFSCGLHMVGAPTTTGEAIATLMRISQLDWLEDRIEGIPPVIAVLVGHDIDELYRRNNQGVLVDVKSNKNVNRASHATNLAIVNQPTDYIRDKTQIKHGLGGPEGNRMKSQTLRIPKTRTLAEACAGRMNDFPKTNNCVVPPEIDGNMSQNANQFDLLLTHTSFTAAPLVNISGMISVIIGAPRQLKIIVQGGKNGVKMPSPTMLSCFDLVLACFTHTNGFCNEEEGALVFAKVVSHFSRACFF
jgi:magnesium chelatase subunit H